MIVLDQISKHYRRGVPVLVDVDAALPDGAPTVISGSNGSGKSTLLRIVAGVLAPTSGRVRGRPRSIGYLPAPFPAELRCSAIGYLQHLAAVRGLPRSRATGYAADLLDRLGFAGDASAPLRTLSEGNAHKVGLAQALLPTEGIVILDEPWSGLDAAAQDTLDALVPELLADGRSVLVTDHAGHALRLPSRAALLLRAGRLGALPGEPAAVVLIELTGSVPALESLANSSGVVETRPIERGLRLRVAAEHSDAILAEALRRGASVRTVLSSPPSSPPSAPASERVDS